MNECERKRGDEININSGNRNSCVCTGQDAQRNTNNGKLIAPETYREEKIDREAGIWD